MKPTNRYSSVRIMALFLAVSSLTFGPPRAFAQNWPQWGNDPQHTGAAGVAGQNLNNILASIVYDPFVEQEKGDPDGEGDLGVHYQAPLVDGKDIYMEFKTGEYTSLFSWETQIWNEKKLTLDGNNIVVQWNFESDWKPAPNADGSLTREPVFHAALSGNFVYIPGAGGTVFKVKKSNGSLVARYNPFGAEMDAEDVGGLAKKIFVSGPITADSAGNIYYNAIKFNKKDPWFSDIRNSWLVKVSPSGVINKATYKSIATGEMKPNDPCEVGFDEPPPWPPTPTAVAPTTPCGTVRPGLNVAPAIGPDGTIYTVARNHLVTRYGYVMAVNPNLTPKWTATTHGVLNDGCNVLIPPNGTPGGCSAGATTGVAPDTNSRPSGRINDNSTSSPVVAPDGSIIYGAQTRYNYGQGHLLHYSATGQFLHSYLFGWDITPAIYRHGGTYSIVLKDNHYNVSSYCNDDAVCPPDRNSSNPGDPEAYYITQLSPTFNVEWQYKNTNPLTCTRNPDNTVTCVNDSPFGFEWCVNGMAVDMHGVVYANSEDGNVYAIRQGGSLKDTLFIKQSISSAYTPSVIGYKGKLYVQQNGELSIVGN